MMRSVFSKTQILFEQLLFELGTAPIHKHLMFFTSRIGIIVLSKRFRKYLVYVSHDGYHLDLELLETTKVAASAIRAVPVIVSERFRNTPLDDRVLNLRRGVLVMSKEILLNHLRYDQNPSVIRTTGGEVSRLNLTLLHQMILTYPDLAVTLMVTRPTLRRYLREEQVFVPTTRLQTIQARHQLDLSSEIDIYRASTLLLQRQLFYTSPVHLNQSLLRLIIELGDETRGIWLSGRAPD